MPAPRTGTRPTAPAAGSPHGRLRPRGGAAHAGPAPFCTTPRLMRVRGDNVTALPPAAGTPYDGDKRGTLTWSMDSAPAVWV